MPKLKPSQLTSSFYSFSLLLIVLMSSSLANSRTMAQGLMLSKPQISLNSIKIRTLINNKPIEQDQSYASHHQCILAKLSPLLGNPLDNTALYLVRQHINSQCFYQSGYINSGIVFPDQDFKKGLLIVHFIAGEINQLTINQPKFLAKSWYQSQLQRALKPPFQLNQLRESLLLLEQFPVIEKVDASLKPSAILGQGSLHMKVFEKTPYALKFQIDNHHASPSVGKVFFKLKASHYSLTGIGDTLELDSTYATGLQKLGLRYRYPLTGASWLNLRAELAQSSIIEQPFKRLNISNQVQSLTLSYEYDYIKTLNQKLQAFIGINMQHSQSKLLGKDYSFSPGVVNGKSKLSVIELGLRWNQQILDNRLVDSAWTLENTLQFGIPLIEAKRTANGPDGNFIKWQLQGQWRKRLSDNGNYQLLLRLNAQWTNSPLLPLEVFSVGGINSVRGYRQSQISRDKGWSASINLPMQGLISPKLEITPFIDLGQAWDIDKDNKSNLSSIGTTINWTANKNWQLQAYLAKRLSHKSSQGSSLQDKGLGLQIQYRLEP